MKKILCLIFVAGVLFADVRFDEVLRVNYNDNLFKIRIENSGIYCLSSFKTIDDKIALNLFDENKVILFSNNKYEKTLIEKSSNDFYFDSEKQVILLNSEELRAKLDFSNYQNSALIGKDGHYLDSFNKIVDVFVDVNKKVSLIVNNNTLYEHYYNNINFADLIGIDASGNYFLITEKITTQFPLNVERTILVISPNGEIINKFNVPTIKYLTLDSEFSIDKEGNLYHLISYPDHLSVLRISGLQEKNLEINYPSEFNEYVHYNDFVTTNELQSEIPTSSIGTEATVSRVTTIKNAETYVTFKYICKSSNLAPNGIADPNGDMVKTPNWLIVGWNARIPYMWGGFSSLAQFQNGLAANRYAGDIHTTGVSSYAVGLDCSGFVSKCWGLSYHASTAYMPNIATNLNDWALIKAGDAVLKTGHVRLYLNRTQNGALRIAEATSRNWAVDYYSYAISDLGAYGPFKYNNMEDEFNEKIITLNSCIKENDKVHLNWDCDTTGLVGYRLYKSTNGKTWNLVSDENTLKLKDVLLDLPTEPTFYRVSVVKTISSANYESNWSNLLGVSPLESTKRFLIVDGFNRNSGTASYQGQNTIFSAIYGLALKSNNTAFDNVKNFAVTSELLNNYTGVFWFVGDEGTGDESISTLEQGSLKNYLESGGRLYISGSEIGYDLEAYGSEDDKAFYANYLKADYISDNSLSKIVENVESSIYDSLSMRIGQVYDEDYPDAILPINGGELCLKYSNDKGAGIVYEGKFGSSTKVGKMVYFAFPLETTADDTAFYRVVRRTVSFFEDAISSVEDNNIPEDFVINNSYPNPFNSTTNLSFVLNTKSDVKVCIYNLLGQEIEIIYNGTLEAGKYSYKFSNNSLSSGIYIASFKINSKIYTNKLCLIK